MPSLFIVMEENMEIYYNALTFWMPSFGNDVLRFEYEIDCPPIDVPSFSWSALRETEKFAAHPFIRNAPQLLGHTKYSARHNKCGGRMLIRTPNSPTNFFLVKRYLLQPLPI